MGRPPQCDHCCPTTTTTTTTTDEPPPTTDPPDVTTTPDPPLPCGFYGQSYFFCRYRYNSDTGVFNYVDGGPDFYCNCTCPGASRVYTDFVAANGGPPSDGACATYLMPCCTEDNVNSFSCEPVGIIIEATCPGDPPPLPTTTTTTEDPTATTTTGPTTTTTPTPETPFTVFWCALRKCEADCCDNGTDLSYIYKPVLCQQFPDLRQAQRFRDDLTDHISYLVAGTCEENNDTAQESFCFECNDRCCTTTSTTEDPSATTTTTTTTTEDPGLGACLLCSDGQIVCTDSITSSTCDFFADIINANWNQHYPNETCSDHPEVGDNCSGFTTTTTTEAPTTTTNTPEPTTTTTGGPELGCCRDCAADCDGGGIIYNDVTREFCQNLGLFFDPLCFINYLLLPCCYTDDCPPCVTTTSIPGGGGDPDSDDNPKPEGFEQ